MLDLFERWVQYHELHIDSEPVHAPPIPLSSLLPHLQLRIKADQCIKLIKKETAALKIADIHHDKKRKIAVLLVQYADMNVSDPSFMHLKKGRLRGVPKLEGEGVAVSAHVAISLEPHGDFGVRYRLLLEEVIGLGRSRLDPFIKSELKEAAKGNFEFEDIEDNNRTKNRLPAAKIEGTPDKSLMMDIEEGSVLQGIELVKLNSKTTEFDEDGYYTEESRTIKLAPDPKVNFVDLIKRLRPKAKKLGYQNIRLRYRHGAGKQKTAAMGTTEQDLADVLVLRTEKIRADEVLAQCAEEIVPSISAKMVGLLVKARSGQ